MKDEDVKRVIAALESIATTLDGLETIAMFKGEVMTDCIRELTTEIRKEHT